MKDTKRFGWGRTYTICWRHEPTIAELDLADKIQDFIDMVELESGK